MSAATLGEDDTRLKSEQPTAVAKAAPVEAPRPSPAPSAKATAARATTRPAEQAVKTPADPGPQASLAFDDPMLTEALAEVSFAWDYSPAPLATSSPTPGAAAAPPQRTPNP
jgi:hypothetical protein